MRTVTTIEGTQLIESLQDLHSYDLKGVPPPPLKKQISTHQFRAQEEYIITDNPLPPLPLHPPEFSIKNMRTGSHLPLQRKNG